MMPFQSAFPCLGWNTLRVGYGSALSLLIELPPVEGTANGISYATAASKVGSKVRAMRIEYRYFLVLTPKSHVSSIEVLERFYFPCGKLT
ncbi:hypothetical protein D3C71_1744910 [compost metagenome]